MGFEVIGRAVAEGEMTSFDVVVSDVVADLLLVHTVVHTIVSFFFMLRRC